MRVHLAVGVAAALLLLAPPAKAQQSDATTRQSPPAASAGQGAQPSADDMGISLKSIRKQLGQQPAQPTQSGKGLRYDFFVDVLGVRPPVDFFKDFDLSTKGGVRWGTPTHQEILSAMSPYWVNAARPVGSGVDLLAAIRKQ